MKYAVNMFTATARAWKDYVSANQRTFAEKVILGAGLEGLVCVFRYFFRVGKHLQEKNFLHKL